MSNDPQAASQSSIEQPTGDVSGAVVRLTPELIRSRISPGRLAVLGKHLEFSTTHRASDATTQCVRMMALLQPEELRALAQAIKVADDGRFIDVFRRLAERC